MDYYDKYLKYKNKYLNLSILKGGFSFMDKKNDDTFYNYINNFLCENNRSDYFNFNESNKPIKSFNEIVSEFNSPDYLKLYQYLISIYFDTRTYNKTYYKQNLEEIPYTDLKKYHIHYAA